MSTQERRESADPKHFGDNFIPIIFVDSLEHTTDRPFCWDMTCPCHEDPDTIAEVHQAYQDGLLTAENATQIVRGQTI